MVSLYVMVCILRELHIQEKLSGSLIWHLHIVTWLWRKKLMLSTTWNILFKTYFMLGCSGPFGILDVKDNSMITYKILTLHKLVRPVQTDGCNCRLIYCLFVYNMMLQFGNPYYDILLHGTRELPI